MYVCYYVFLCDESLPICDYIKMKIQRNLSKQTFRIKEAIEKTSVIRTKNLAPKGLTNVFLFFDRGKPLYYSKKWPKIFGPY